MPVNWHCAAAWPAKCQDPHLELCAVLHIRKIVEGCTVVELVQNHDLWCIAQLLMQNAGFNCNAVLALHAAACRVAAGEGPHYICKLQQASHFEPTRAQACTNVAGKEHAACTKIGVDTVPEQW